MSLLKAVLLGTILTFVVSGAIWASHSTGGFLHIREVALGGHYLQWSWPLFVSATGLGWGIMLLMK